MPSDVFPSFQNTGEEDERTLVFLAEMQRRWGVEITWLEYNDVFNIEDYRRADGSLSTKRRKRNLQNRDEWGFDIVSFETACRNGEPYDRMLAYYAEYRKQIKGLPPVLPNVPQRLCTAYLKIKINQRWMNVLGHREYTSISGIRADEPHRYARMMAQNQNHKLPYEYDCPLYHAGVTSGDILSAWRGRDFDLGLDPNSEAGNCGLCYLKRKGVLVRLMREKIAANNGIVPAELIRWRRREQESGQVFRRDRPNFESLINEALTGETDGNLNLFDDVSTAFAGRQHDGTYVHGFHSHGR